MTEINQHKSTGDSLSQLIEIVEKLRAPGGCPWDRDQTQVSLLPYFLEEIYEVIESVEEGNMELLKEELGDILLHVVFQASIGKENEDFTLQDSLNYVNEKLIRRHPHVFADAKAEGPFHAKQNWEAAKHDEKKRESRLDGVPGTLPALTRSQRLQEKASYAGFDWKKVEQVWEKVHEEIGELKEAEEKGITEQIEEELGDTLFSIVNLSRFLGISAETALRKTNRKFTSRFAKVEEELKKRGKTVEDSSLEEMDEIWNAVKNNDD
ncbi:MAG: nucleoside triphosphate pyrophosphohydrolase [Candidatus Marinimicrobia bacterium]|jgi:tetrapyrrole methylase family protein/MazG family protein|nr:nucleoside triphosphate pyrophosphohydrolase [Candidatus Neomarinimicrobiota bacterium]MEE1505928.1 nucleoside triphosphate pyrophosphohydrolase [Candidatus Neomarinimicrobiota bacterium]MEE1574158.1 nucleoside triphosphate pyrophosphohydrolase [Candidatus Neomarinimicrobiota bacterium]HJN69458.1 nucleoside triphosphate pyrophosphohydrolase [Candidatus Neomarinimicrobiota bacterium]|tara:strand:- start:39 stop:836 length:798 start_codon:yes stop_codon:yes gene_type:complete